MKKALVKLHGQPAGILQEDRNSYQFTYFPDYHGKGISLTLPINNTPYQFDALPSFFDGLLPEGPQLEGLLRRNKIDQRDFMSQLIAVGEDLVGAVTIHEFEDE